jgi:hypothetical protein
MLETRFCQKWRGPRGFGVDLPRTKLGYSDSEIWGSYIGDVIKVRWSMERKVPVKHVSTPTLKSVFNCVCVCVREREREREWSEKWFEIVYIGVTNMGVRCGVNNYNCLATNDIWGDEGCWDESNAFMSVGRAYLPQAKHNNYHVCCVWRTRKASTRLWC